MGVFVSIAPGADASYPWKQIGTSDASRAAAGGPAYYLSPAQKGGEPPGRWAGEGAADFGFHDGEVVERAPFEMLYGQHLDPRDPSGQAHVGVAPRRSAAADALYAQKLALEPEATAERRRELMMEARAETKGAPRMYWDTTLSVDKSTSLAYAAALAAADEAQLAGDFGGAGFYREQAAGIWAEIEKATRLYINYMQQRARHVRTGHHGRSDCASGRLETGRFEDAWEIPVAIFPQHTSRDGDPQLHVHILWLNKVKTVRDGVWRASDSRALHRARGAGSALASYGLETGIVTRSTVQAILPAEGRAPAWSCCAVPVLPVIRAAATP